MSYKAFTKLQKHVEVEFIKRQTPEQINDIFRQLKAKNDEKDKRIQELESAIRDHEELTKNSFKMADFNCWAFGWIQKKLWAVLDKTEDKE